MHYVIAQMCCIQKPLKIEKNIRGINMNESTVIGFMGGLIAVGLALLLKRKRLEKQGKSTKEYDERQKLMRGKGLALSLAIYVVLTMVSGILADEGIVWAETRFTEFLFIFITAAAVNVVFNIFHDSYYSFTNEKRSCKKMLLIDVLCVTPLVVVGIRSLNEGRYFVDGKVTAEASWIAVVAMFVVLLVSTNIRFWQNRKAEAEDETEDEE